MNTEWSGTNHLWLPPFFSYSTQETASWWLAQSYNVSFSRARTKDNFLQTTPLNNGQFFVSKAIKLQFQNLLALSIPGHTPLHLELEGCLLLQIHSFQALNFKMMWIVIKDMDVSVSNWQLLALCLQEMYLRIWIRSWNICHIFPHVKYSIVHSQPSQEAMVGQHCKGKKGTFTGCYGKIKLLAFFLV